MTTITGKCLCGGVSFEAPLAEHLDACHCDICRRQVSSPFMGMACHDGITLTKSDTLVWYDSSDWARRGFCSACGSVLFYNLKGSEFYSVSVGALENPPDTLVLKEEYFIDEKPAFYDFAGDRVRKTGEEVFAAFAGETSND